MHKNTHSSYAIVSVLCAAVFYLFIMWRDIFNVFFRAVANEMRFWDVGPWRRFFPGLFPRDMGFWDLGPRRRAHRRGGPAAGDRRVAGGAAGGAVLRWVGMNPPNFSPPPIFHLVLFGTCRHGQRRLTPLCS